jgi:hypothetical protein
MTDLHPPEAVHDPPNSGRYELVVRSQAGAESLLRSLGALAEIERAVVGHCEGFRPAPPYRPQLIKKLLEPHGWLPEVRVPPYDPVHDDALTINERYDLLKFFDVEGGRVGVAVEMNNWMVHRDLLKFRRGLARGQIAVGVILQPDYATTYYCWEHFRHLNEPLFGDLPVAYCCPRGPGLKEPPARKKVKYRPYLFP